MGITAQTKFLINYDDNNAFSIIEFDKGKVTTNEISIGLNTLTIQTLIHGRDSNSKQSYLNY